MIMVKTYKFWNWFKEHAGTYASLDTLKPEKQEKLLDELLKQLHLYCDHLYFEMGGKPGEEQELIITAEGNKNYFNEVELLIADAPLINNWKFTAFIQPQYVKNTIDYEGVELKPFEIWFMPLNSASNPKSIGIKVCLPNYQKVKNNKWMKPAVYKCLDHLLGEQNFALDLAHIEIGELPAKPEEQGLIELKDLPAYIKWRKKKVGV